MRTVYDVFNGVPFLYPVAYVAFWPLLGWPTKPSWDPPCQKSCPLSYRVGVEPWSSPIGWGPPGTQTGTSKDYYACGWTCQKSYPLSSCDVGVDPTARAPAGGRTCTSGDSAPWSSCQKSCPHLIRRNEPPTGALSSNTILRFEKASHTYHFHSPKMSRTRCVALL